MSEVKPQWNFLVWSEVENSQWVFLISVARTGERLYILCTHSALFMIWELEIQKNSRGAASWEFPHRGYLRKTSLELLMNKLMLLAGSDTRIKTCTRICATIACITVLGERKKSGRTIT